VKNKYRVAKMQRMPYFYKSFPAKEPYTERLFGEKRPATQGITCIFATLQEAHDKYDATHRFK